MLAAATPRAAPRSAATRPAAFTPSVEEQTMRYDEQDRQSDSFEDRRGGGGMFSGRGGMGIPIPIGGGGMSITPLLIIRAIFPMLCINPLTPLTPACTTHHPPTPPP